MKKEYNLETMVSLTDYLDSRGWHYSVDEDRGLIRYGMRLKGRLSQVNYVIDVGDDCYNVYAVSPISADHEDSGQMNRIAEFICRANYGLQNGNFELDFRDGEIRYKCYESCEGQIPTAEAISWSTSCPTVMFERYGEGILQVLFAGMSAQEAIELCEKPKFPFGLPWFDEDFELEDDEDEDECETDDEEYDDEEYEDEDDETDDETVEEFDEEFARAAIDRILRRIKSGSNS